MTLHSVIGCIKNVVPVFALLSALFTFSANTTSASEADFFWFWDQPSEHEEWEYIHSVKELRTHFHAHRFRVRALAMRAIQLHPELLNTGITIGDVYEFLSLHDMAKVEDSREFREKFWPKEALNKESFINRLFEIYGTGLFPGNAAKHAEALKMIEELNIADSAVAKDFFRKQRWLLPDGEMNAKAKAVLRIERIADVVDRNSDPVAQEELGVSKPRALSEFFVKKDGTVDQLNLGIASKLKEQYNQTIAGLSYENILEFPTTIDKAVAHYRDLETRIRSLKLYAKHLSQFYINKSSGCQMLLNLSNNQYTLIPTQTVKLHGRILKNTPNLRGSH